MELSPLFRQQGAGGIPGRDGTDGQKVNPELKEPRFHLQAMRQLPHRRKYEPILKRGIQDFVSILLSLNFNNESQNKLQVILPFFAAVLMEIHVSSYRGDSFFTLQSSQYHKYFPLVRIFVSLSVAKSDQSVSAGYL